MEPDQKTNKQAKYKQRHWNKEQTDSNQRGEGRWITRERRRRVVKERVWRTHGQSQRRIGLRAGGGGGWDWGGDGGTRDNCTWKTINNYLKTYVLENFHFTCLVKQVAKICSQYFSLVIYVSFFLVGLLSFLMLLTLIFHLFLISLAEICRLVWFGCFLVVQRSTCRTLL